MEWKFFNPPGHFEPVSFPFKFSPSDPLLHHPLHLSSTTHTQDHSIYPASIKKKDEEERGDGDEVKWEKDGKRLTLSCYGQYK